MMSQTHLLIFVPLILCAKHFQTCQTQISTGILTCCPSHTPYGLWLGPTYPTLINIGSETLGIRRECFSHSNATHTGILTSIRSTAPHRYCFTANRTLPYHTTAPQWKSEIRNNKSET